MRTIFPNAETEVSCEEIAWGRAPKRFSAFSLSSIIMYHMQNENLLWPLHSHDKRLTWASKKDKLWPTEFLLTQDYFVFIRAAVNGVQMTSKGPITSSTEIYCSRWSLTANLKQSAVHSRLNRTSGKTSLWFVTKSPGCTNLTSQWILKATLRGLFVSMWTKSPSIHVPKGMLRSLIRCSRDMKFSWKLAYLAAGVTLNQSKNFCVKSGALVLTLLHICPNSYVT